MLSLCKGTFSYWKFQVNKPSTELPLTLCYSYQYYVFSNLYDRRLSTNRNKTYFDVPTTNGSVYTMHDAIASG